MDERVEAWAACGAMALTGRAGEPPLGPPAPLVPTLRRWAAPLGIDPLPLLVERAAVTGLTRGGDTSCGGVTKLLPTVDGWIGVSLARPDDTDLLPAWLGIDAGAGWTAVAAAIASRTAADLDAGAALLGLPASALPAAPFATPPVRAHDYGPARARRRPPPTVLDLTSLWAGPLCTRLLLERGASVTKVESRDRPDGARLGPPAFFAALNDGKAELAVDLAADLPDLIAGADVVVEAARPRALEQLGVVAAALMLDPAGPTVWVSITAHGRAADRVGFGDDAAVGGGLVVFDDRGPCFCADAIADPVAGVVAAAATLTALASGRRWLLDVSLAGAAAGLAGPTLPAPSRGS